MQSLKLETGLGIENSKRVQITFTKGYSDKEEVVELANHELQEAIMVYLDMMKTEIIEGVTMTSTNSIYNLN